MKISPTLSRYLARSYFLNMLFLLLALLGVLYIFDSVEVLRRAAKRPDVSLRIVLEMSLLKLPKDGQVLFPFAVLYSGMFTFWQLTRRNELIVARSAGFSFWQFVAPVITIAALAGALQMMVINPVSSLLVAKYERMERRYIDRGSEADTEVALFKEGIWLRQGTADGYAIIHSAKIEKPGWTMQAPLALFFTPSDQFLRRVDAARARLEKDQWIFEDATVEEGGKSVPKDTFLLSTTLTRNDVENSFSSPAAMSFWRLPSHIQTLEETGFDASRLRVYYQNLLAQPLMFAAMILLAASVSLRPPRAQGTLGLVVIGVFLGFVVFFLSSFLQALGSTQQIPVLLAAWAPALISFMLGLSVMMSLEDG